MKLSRRELYAQIEREIAEEAPTNRDINRGQLKKHLGKEMIFTAVFGNNHAEQESAIVRDIRIKGESKVLCDHQWFSKRFSFDFGDEIEFKGIVGTYNDAKGNRKYKIKDIRIRN